MPAATSAATGRRKPRDLIALVIALRRLPDGYACFASLLRTLRSGVDRTAFNADTPRVRGLPTYRGPFGPEQAERLLWRAGFGPRKGQAEKLAKLGLDRAVHSLTHPGRTRLTGPAPKDEKGRPLAPIDAWGHDALWWLDRMVRSTAPLVERMTLIWHDWFATSNDGVGSQRLMLRQNNVFRVRGLGSFRRLLLEVTSDPAMLLWLSGSDNSRWSPNENYARELMELFTLGAGRGYTEQDVREQARALTGFRNDWSESKGPFHFRYDPKYHDPGGKRIFGKRGRFTWRDSCRLCLTHRAHPTFFVTKLWSYFVPTPPSRATRQALERLYVSSRYAIAPVVEAILKHPALYTGPRMTKPPAVLTAGLLRAIGRGVDTTAWVWLGGLAGQQLFYPPNVAGWDDGRWLDTATYRARWMTAGYALRPYNVSTKTQRPRDPAELVASAVAFLGHPTLTDSTRSALHQFANAALADANAAWKKNQYPSLIENALRQLIAASPDYQTC
jgi:hypothetical protein